MWLKLYMQAHLCPADKKFLKLLLVTCRAIAAENSKKEVKRTVLGIVQPGDTIPVPYGWQKAGLLSAMMLSIQCDCMYCVAMAETHTSVMCPQQTHMHDAFFHMHVIPVLLDK